MLEVYALHGKSVSLPPITPEPKSCSGTGFCTKKCVKVRGFLLYSEIDASAASSDHCLVVHQAEHRTESKKYITETDRG